MMSDPVFEIFREEARDHLGALEKGFLDLEAAAELAARRTLIDNLFRHAHSLKSDAKVVGLTELKHAAQNLEELLDELREAPQHVERSAIDLGLQRLDGVRAAFEAWRTGGEEAASAPPAAVAPPAVAPRPDAPSAVAPSAAPQEAAPPNEPAPRAGAELARAGGSPPAEESFTVKVRSERLDRMLSLTGEVRISQRSGALLAERLRDLQKFVASVAKGIDRRPLADTQHALEAMLDQVRRLEGDLRKRRNREELLVEALEADIRQARLLPLAMLADSLRRAVRDLAVSLGKEIAYETDVGKILLDKAVIEALKDPLLHLVRNAADHGLETTPAERRAAGKPEVGTIRIAASQRGPMVRIAVSDDGRGIDFSSVRQRLVQLGAADESQARAMTEAELKDHLFRPGFTTASAGEVSGRGVGLDVVLDALRRLQGSVELISQPQRGATFVLNVPVTVATVRIVTVVAGGQVYGVPSAMIVRTGRARREELRELEGCPILPVEGQPVPWTPLGRLLGVPPAARAASEAAYSYLLIDRQGKRLAVAVDELEDESEVLLKPLGFPLQALPGVVGAAIRADGSVQLVLDLASPVWTDAPSGAVVRPHVAPAAVRILVVDDSPTTRAVLRNVFTAAGFLVRTAADGVEALEQLRTQAADLVVTDVEMPRLGGLELTRQIKRKHGLPVILVTGKEKEEHRREGLAAGADAYVVKSTFEGEGLLDIVRQLVGT